MPNWCNNSLTIKGSKKSIDAILSAFIKPNPFVNLIGYDSDNYAKGDWYKHNTERFGTKWDVDYAVCERYGDTAMKAQFDTAWSPPCAFVEEMCKRYEVEACMNYEEFGMGFQGTFIVDAEGNATDTCWEL
jgi:hypothetical protein